MASRLVGKTILSAKFISYVLGFFGKALGQAIIGLLAAPFQKGAAGSGQHIPESELRNIVVVGASFAGYHAARVIATGLPPDSPYRVIVVEPHSHFHFTWVLPRFCVVNHEEKAFIPYGALLKGVPSQRLKWVQDRVSSISRQSVTLHDAGIDIPYDFLVIATGSGATDGLPSRVGSNDKATGIELLQKFQARIAHAEKIVVVGGGAAGVELATDAKEKYPAKHITLVHSREAVMHRFGPELQEAAKKGIEALGIELVLGERATKSNTDEKSVLLSSGRRIECDLLIDCAGQKPSSDILLGLSPSSIASSGKISVKPSLQISDDSLPNIYVCGDVSETGVRNPNARFAYSQALAAASNVILAAQGKTPTNKYTKFWGDGVIKLTLGITRSVTHMSDGTTELLFNGKEKVEELMSARAWSQMGATPYADPNPEGPVIKCTPEQVAALAVSSSAASSSATDASAHKTASAVETAVPVEGAAVEKVTV
ncbi:hypothetical protein Micbo1qcDRAFT_33028 [Microdochium bolleyi]|uniref:FAD/NAD(P)-binding domain-containing protein n=1 Tax=Microdochium bolleyi TaxID=196109 RepID=A0A136IPQ9_9PEZI|nr:hypothetical protein Micbo1qcDRAFT_33028 [Microdochium bolleyi]